MTLSDLFSNKRSDGRANNAVVEVQLDQKHESRQHFHKTIDRDKIAVKNYKRKLNIFSGLKYIKSRLSYYWKI